MISNRLGWIIMEGWAPVIFLIASLWQFHYNRYAVIFSCLYLFHYIYRSFIYPFRIKTAGKQMPVMIMFSAMCFNSINAGINGFYLNHFGSYPGNYFAHWNFIAGIVLFFGGLFINVHSDNILIGLRASGETGYKIPDGFLYRYVSCPNLFGEMIEWFGFALLCWNLAALSFFIWTV
jgi:hypothetical protein